MGMLGQTLAELERKMRDAFPGTAVTTREIGSRIDVTVNALSDDLESVRRAVWEAVDSSKHLAIHQIISEQETHDTWLLNASMTDGMEDQNITLTVSYFRQFTRLQLSIVWPNADRAVGMESPGNAAVRRASRAHFLYHGSLREPGPTPKGTLRV